jgi:hypothetical protein
LERLRERSPIQISAGDLDLTPGKMPKRAARSPQKPTYNTYCTPEPPLCHLRPTLPPEGLRFEPVDLGSSRVLEREREREREREEREREDKEANLPWHELPRQPDEEHKDNA